jgi:hypothetical protein
MRRSLILGRNLVSWSCCGSQSQVFSTHVSTPFWRGLLSSLSAYSQGWYLGQRHWSDNKAKTIPKEHWEYKLVTSDSEGIYKISETLLKEYEKHIDELKEPRGVG